MKETEKIIIAIDPDTEKSGVAMLESKLRTIEACSMDFPTLLYMLQKIADLYRFSKTMRIIVVVEAGWVNKVSNYHTAAGRKGQRIAKNVGANHETGKKIVEMAKSYGLEVIEQPPLKKIWQGKNGKITQDELDRLIASKNDIIFLGYEPSNKSFRMSQDARDAALIALYYANLL